MEFHRYPHTFAEQVHLLVSNLQRSLAFYKDMIGFQILEQSESKVIFTVDGKKPLLTIEQPEHIGPREPRATGLYHFALLLPSRADLARVLRHFIETRYPLQGASDHLVSEALYLADPDGHGIEIYSDRSAADWNWNNNEVEMATVYLDVENLLLEGTDHKWNGLPKGTILGHIHLHVSNLKDTEVFYCKGLDFEVVTRYGSQALFISTGKYHHHIGLNTWNGVGAPAPSENSIRMKWFSLVLPSEDARRKVTEQLRHLGAYVAEQNGVVVTKDPSGTEIHLHI